MIIFLCSKNNGFGTKGAERLLHLPARGEGCSFMKMCLAHPVLPLPLGTPHPSLVFLKKNTINYRRLFLPVLKAQKFKIMVPADPVFGERHDSLGDPCVRWQVLGRMILDHSEQGPGKGLMVSMNPISFLPNIVSMCLLLNFVKRSLEMMAGSKDFSQPPKGKELLERTENV